MAEMHRQRNLDVAQFQTDDDEDEVLEADGGIYFRKLEYVAGKTIVLCALDQQLEALMCADEIYIDMTFRAMAAVCVFTNGLDNVVYKKIFAMVDALCKEETGCRLRFRYVDGEETSIKVMTGPFLGAKGWGKLSAQLERLCAECIQILQGALYPMLNIQYCDETSINAIFDSIIVAVENIGVDISAWVRYYKQRVVSGSLNPAFSKIPGHVWRSTSDNSNPIEALHSDINRSGRYLTLLRCIRSRHEYDLGKWTMSHIGKQTGVPYKTPKSTKQHAKSAISRQQNTAAKKKGQKEKSAAKGTTSKSARGKAAAVVIKLDTESDEDSPKKLKLRAKPKPTSSKRTAAMSVTVLDSDYADEGAHLAAVELVEKKNAIWEREIEEDLKDIALLKKAKEVREKLRLAREEAE
ncbi:hypothetical protein DFS34DRAFT_596163 [Phlyctochytrium arcticum]|nr:hypothetical protein DFS34DRAFT_596163 [Phlyctochytrium arcticum]